jgi:hypothetical protein
METYLLSKTPETEKPLQGFFSSNRGSKDRAWGTGDEGKEVM